MMHQQLVARVCVAAPDVEYMVYPAGLEGKFYLAEKGRPGLHLIDATAEEVLDFVKARKPSENTNA